MTKCNLLEYDVPFGVGGSIGLFRFGLSSQTGCLAFTEETAEDATFGPARTGAIISFILALCLLALNVVHYFVYALPQKDVVFYAIGGGVQLSLALVQLLWKNELCETYGCYKGDGSSWICLAHIMYLAATCVSLFIDTPPHSSKTRPLQQQIYSITTPFVRKASSRSILEIR